MDSEATNHMTNFSQLFVTYNPCPRNRKIKVVIGSSATVAGQGEVFLTSSISLKYLLHVLNYL